MVRSADKLYQSWADPEGGRGLRTPWRGQLDSSNYYSRKVCMASLQYVDDIKKYFQDPTTIGQNFLDPFLPRVQYGNVGHQVISDINMQTMGIQMRQLLMSRLIRIFTFCFMLH